MQLLSRLTLRQMLTLPYIALVLLLTGTIGALSYSAGQQAVDTLSDQLLTETVNRITQAVDRHVAGSAAVLETAFPKGVPAPAAVADDLQALRTRFWLATSVHRDPNNYAYYGDVQGHFFGLWRHGQDEAELRLRVEGSGPRSISRFSGMSGVLRDTQPEQRIFEPRERPWFKVAQSSGLHAWTSIYIDFKSAELVATRARRVNDAEGLFRGVVATDLSLERVNQFLRALPLSAHGLAFVVERDGNLIGVSRGPHLKRQADGSNVRLSAAEHENPLVRETYKAYQGLLERQSGQLPRTDVFEGPDGGAVQVAHARMHDNAGLDWIVLVAVPRSDFLHRVTDNFRHTVLLAGLAALAVLAIGLGVLGVVSRDLASLAQMARSFGEGQAEPPLAVARRDEIGELARSFVTLQRRLMTDRLTGLANREAVTRRIDERLQRHRRRGDERPFAVLFVDLNRFKQINDSHGHDMGDRVLQELAERLRQAVRAEDDVARYAGDEFLVVLDSVGNRRDAEHVRHLLEQRLREPLRTLAGLDDALAGAAIGLAMFPDDARDADTLVQRADEDMYRRK
ncbi:GGDEF domain-containing protein [Aquabacterium sp. OR-4]|uniref:GGDEF domain-containing protein n=1 Tax=Aquabacterium sp. OR-4 TaxID=2978127 RepID=UPI0028C7814B|nr:diguanylate cyclase [Aquabacterium sp. OR-4]MDT7833884.1 diguanylate cyclase [Aquabacterium sp. OR-4]